MKKYPLYILLSILTLISTTPVHELGHVIIAESYQMEIVDVVWYKFAFSPPLLGTGSVTVTALSIPSELADYHLSMGGSMLEAFYIILLIFIGLKKKWWWLIIPAQMSLSWLPIYAISDLHDFYPNFYKNSFLIYGFYFGSILTYAIPLLNSEEWFPKSLLKREIRMKPIIKFRYKDKIIVKPPFLHDFGDNAHHMSMMRTVEREDDGDGDYIIGTGPSKGKFAIHEVLDDCIFYPFQRWIIKHFGDSKTYERLRIILGFFWGFNCGFPFRDVTLYTLWSCRDCVHEAVFVKKAGKWVNKYPNSTLMGFK